MLTFFVSFISVNGGLLLRFNFIWFDTTTFLAYSEEAGSESVMVRASGGLQLASITHVLAALTPNAKKIFLLLARQSCAPLPLIRYIAFYLKKREVMQKV
jgi:hypothetical protein